MRKLFYESGYCPRDDIEKEIPIDYLFAGHTGTCDLWAKGMNRCEDCDHDGNSVCNHCPIHANAPSSRTD